MRWIPTLACTALILGGCDGSPPAAQGTESGSLDAAGGGSMSFCSKLTSASDTGNLLMQGAFTSTKGGEEFSNDTVMENLAKQNGYRFVGADLIGKTCWAYAVAKGEMYGKPIYLSWRCPVKAYSDNPEQPGSTVLQLVENQSCDFSVDRGDPAKREVDVAVIKM